MKHTPIKLGPLALLLAVISICLTTLAMLNYSTAQADLRLAEKYAKTVAARYSLETQGQELLSRLSEDASDQTPDGWDTGVDGIIRKTLEEDGMYLRIGLTSDDTGGWRIVSWTYEKDWEPDTLITDLWTGN